MTIPYERYRAVLNTEEFLLSLCDPKKTPRVPGQIRKMARSCLKHYPHKFEMERACESAPEIFEKEFCLKENK